MVAKIVGMDATSKRASAIGVVRMVFAVEKIGLEMDVMELLGDLVIIYAFCNKAEETEDYIQNLALDLRK